eukprot:TRINITY_DN2004_c0_g1_i3.p1 TRINITY_DN2004_c0_g1~~TRINITY_DN2004_c0_g1_i3.p1  ORF type:complete len:420 (-),score=77.61 TRINITY_DN2004_c0_g1_i3:195-1454(-)
MCIRDSQRRVRGRPCGNMRLYTISDVHVDHVQNMQWVEMLPNQRDDCIIVAGDLSHEISRVRKTLQWFKFKFKEVFFTPGNHDLWLSKSEEGITSIKKLESLMDMCEEEGVHTRAAVIGSAPDGTGGVLVAPILSWHHQSFDTEPDITGWDGIPRVEDAMVDYFRCVWPKHLNPSSDDVAAAVDQMNQPVAEVLALAEGLPVVTFSHFVPLLELTPEKRFLFLPTLNKAVGSVFLGNRVQEIAPTMHVFGHTHFGWDHRIGSTRYVQAALGYPSEWEQREESMKIAELPDEPMFLWDSENGFAPDSAGRWSEYYKDHERTPEVCNALAPYVARMYERLAGGEICALPISNIACDDFELEKHRIAQEEHKRSSTCSDSSEYSEGGTIIMKQSMQPGIQPSSPPIELETRAGNNKCHCIIT